MRKIKGQNMKGWYAAGGLLLLLAIFFSLMLGSRDVTSGRLFAALINGPGAPDQTARIILMNVRLPRTLGAVLCGMGLACAGLLLQSALNNVLAAPGIIGINAGAGLAVLAASIAFPGFVFARSAAAFAGSLLAAGLVCLIANKAGISKTSLILAGVAVSSLMNGFINGIITWRPELVSDKTAFSLGGLSLVSLSALKFSIPFFAGGILIALIISGGIDLFALGDEAAAGIGLNVMACRNLAVFAATILAGAAVSLCGLLSFVGLIIPNLIRLLPAEHFRSRLVLCMLYGSSFLVFCDIIARTLFYPYELPAGLLLSVLGSPFFIWILIRRRRRLSV